MSNRIDKLFREGVLKHHLPNSGPDWAALQARKNGSKKPTYFLWSFAALIFVIGLIALYFKPIGKEVAQNSNHSTENNNSTTNSTIKSNETIQSNNNTPTNNSSTGTSSAPINIAPDHLLLNNQNPGTTSRSTPSRTTNARGTENQNNPTQNSQSIKPEEQMMPASTAKSPNTKEELSTSKKDASADSSSKNETVETTKQNETPANASVKLNSPSVKVTKPRRPGRIYLFASFCPSLLNSKNTNADASSNIKIHKDYSKIKAAGESMKRAMGLNFGISIGVSSRLSVTSGILYEQRTESSNYNFLIKNIPVVDDHTGEILAYFTVSDSSAQKISYQSNNTYSYIGIPVTLNYCFLNWREFNFGVHLNGNYLTQTTMKGQTLNSTYLTLENLSKSNSYQLKNIFNAGFGLDISCGLTKKLIFNITPNFKTQLSKNSRTTNAKQASVNIGLKYFIF